MKSLHLLGRQGITLIAMAGLDMAIWDALAKAVQLPLVSLLGGQPGKIRAYNTNALWLSPLETLADQAKFLINQGGFKALKLRIGRPTLKEDIQAIQTVKAAVGEDILIMTDFNQDGHEDIFVTNGHIDDWRRGGEDFEMTPQLFCYQGPRFIEASSDAGDFFMRKAIGRGVALKYAVSSRSNAEMHRQWQPTARDERLLHPQPVWNA